MIINADIDSMCFHFFGGCSSRNHLPNVFANAATVDNDHQTNNLKPKEDSMG